MLQTGGPPGPRPDSKFCPPPLSPLSRRPTDLGARTIRHEPGFCLCGVFSASCSPPIYTNCEGSVCTTVPIGPRRDASTSRWRQNPSFGPYLFPPPTHPGRLQVKQTVGRKRGAAFPPHASNRKRAPRHPGRREPGERRSGIDPSSVPPA